MQNNEKGNYWNIVIFQDNWEKNPNWKDKLIDTHMRFCISPIHDKDVWTELDATKHPDREDYIMQHLGEPKKLHYHILVHCDQNTTFKTMKEITEDLGLPIPQVCRAPVGMYHYFTHEFNPEKAQYDANDIRHYNGSDPSDYLMELSKYESMKYRRTLAKLIKENNCLNWDEAESVAEALPNPNFQYLFQTNTLYFKQYLVDNIVKEQKRREKL